MSRSPEPLPGDHIPLDRMRNVVSRTALMLAVLVLAATFLLISPPRGQTFPGAIPWRPGSTLHGIVELMSLGGLVSTARGVEIKDFALHLGAALILILLAVRSLLPHQAPQGRRPAPGAWIYAQMLLGAWVAISALSALWSGDPPLALGQTTLYALALAWAVGLAWTLDGRDVARLLAAYVAIAATGALLCVWYYLERNPFHRPGFPIGNPSTLSACVFPAAILAACGLIAAVFADGGGRRRAWLIAGCAVALLPLLACLWLTGSRAGLVGIAAAMGTIAFLRLGRRARLGLLVLAGVALSAGAWYLSTFSANDLAMARGATIRFRLYTWRYAAQLWANRSISGNGAGSFPRLVNPLTLGDRILDPAAFMAENVEHAHNELFEVLAEIGLVGGVTFVAGHVATIAAGFAVIAANLSAARRWLLMGLLAALAGLMVDAMFGVGLRLQGVPAVFYTLVGTLWAASRATFKEPRARPGTRRGPRMWETYGSAAACLLGGIALGWVAVRNFSGALLEQRAAEARIAGRSAEAQRLDRSTEQRLLEPYRILLAARAGVEDGFSVARQRFADWAQAVRDEAARAAPGAASAPAGGEVESFGSLATAAATDSFDAAMRLEARAPAFGRSLITAAYSAELLAWLQAPLEVVQTAQWPQVLRGEMARVAWQAWRGRYLQRPYEYESLIALTRYPATLTDRVVYLRDALRAGLPPPDWFEALRAATALPGFDVQLQELLRAAGPIDPQTDLDVLILSNAPEMHRLAAYYLALHGQYGPAADAARRAASMYRPMQPRFPELHSVALIEEADYRLLDQPESPQASMGLARAALDALPRIQEQKYEELALPFRLRLAKYCAAAGRDGEALAILERVTGEPEKARSQLANVLVELVQMFVKNPALDRSAIERWLEAALRYDPQNHGAWSWAAWLAAESGDADRVRAILRQAGERGLSERDLAPIRQQICREFESLCERIQPK